MGIVTFASLGAVEAAAILNLLHVSHDHSLSILEQAAFLDQLRKLEQTSVAELAEQLSRSKSWVSMRLGLLAEMSPRVREKIFRDRKSTRLNSSHTVISYAVFCLKKKKKKQRQ